MGELSGDERTRRIGFDFIHFLLDYRHKREPDFLFPYLHPTLFWEHHFLIEIIGKYDQRFDFRMEIGMPFLESSGKLLLVGHKVANVY